MPTFVPSQIRDFLDTRFAVARAQVAGGPSFEMPEDYAGALSHLVAMIDGVPQHLLVLRGAEAAEFGESVASIRLALDRWRSGDRSQALRPLVGRNSWSPLSFIRKHVDALPDEGPGAASDRLDFVHDEELRRVLATDLKAIEDSLDRGAWKAATVIAGSVTEALLLTALLARETEARTAGAGLPSSPPTDLTQWTLHHLTEVAAVLKVIDEMTAAQCRIARNFRNLIHPGRAMRLAQICDRGTAFATSAAVEHVIRDLRGRASLLSSPMF